MPTAGSPENLALLLDPHSGVSVSLLQSGTPGAEASSELESLGTLFYEPLWLFHKPRIGKHRVDHRSAGQRISVGPIGSGTRALSLELLRRNGIDETVSELLALPPQEASDKLLAGEIDAALILSASELTVVQKLLADENIELSNFPARRRLYRALSISQQSAGAERCRRFGKGSAAERCDPVCNEGQPDRAQEPASRDPIPAPQCRGADPLEAEHFRRPNQFPAAETIDIPLSSEAQQFYKSGRPYLHNFLPFWAADLFGKLLVLLIPILGVLYPMIRTLPPLYDWVMRSKIARIYGELRFLEDEIIEARQGGRDVTAMAARLDNLEGQANHLRIPVTHASMFYMLRNHIDIVRERLRK